METIINDNNNSVERNHRLPSRQALIVSALAMAVVMLINIVITAMDDSNLVVLCALYIIALGCEALSFSVLARWFNFRSDSGAGLGLGVILSTMALEIGAAIGLAVAMSGVEEAETLVDLIDLALYLAESVSFCNGIVIICGMAQAIGVLMIARALWQLYKSRAHVGYMLLSILAYVVSAVSLIFVFLCFFNENYSDMEGADIVGSLIDILLFNPLLIGIAVMGALNLNRTLIPESEFAAPVVAPTKSLLRHFGIAALMAFAGFIIGLLFDMPWWGFMIAAVIILFALVLLGTYTDDDTEADVDADAEEEQQ